MEAVVERSNLRLAYQRVVGNKGAAGVDGLTVTAFADWLKAHWPSVKAALLAGRYLPQAVRAVDIPKPQGGVRTLGIPTVLDRLIQQALLQILQPMFEPGFSESSYGYRPGRSALQAVQAARGYVREGRRWVVDLDLERFFDTVNHDVLMSKVECRVKDRRVLKLIRRYLEAGLMRDGLVQWRGEGTPQGGPLSPLLSNILLTDLDRELTRRGHAFCRYADDCAPRRREGRLLWLTEAPCCARDEGWPLGLGLQGQGPNHLKLLRHNGWGGERSGKGGIEPVRYVLGRRTKVNRHQRVESVSTSSKPDSSRWSGTKLGGSLSTARAVTGIKAA